MTTAILAISDWLRADATPPRAWRPDWRRLLGAAIVAGGLLHLAALAGQSVAAFLGAHADVRAAAFASLLAGAATGLGAAPLLLLSHISERIRDAALGFGAGVMLAAAAFSLLLPAIEMAGPSGALTVALGFLAGGAFLMLCDRLLPHRHLSGDAHGIGAENVRRVWLFVFAMALHNLPEGLAVGVAYAQPATAPALAFGIGIQNMPEGLVTALALMGAGYGRIAAVALATGTGLLEPVAAAFGSALVAGIAPLLPPGMAFAAGAMVFVVSHEIIPESHRRGHETHATVGVMVGFALMMVLDTAFS